MGVTKQKNVKPPPTYMQLLKLPIRKLDAVASNCGLSVLTTWEISNLRISLKHKHPLLPKEANTPQKSKKNIRPK